MQKKGMIFALILIQVVSCKPQNDMKKYEWRPTANAPKDFPAEILKGDFFMDDNSSIYIPAEHTLMQGWGTTGATHVSGPDLKESPSSFSIKWISYLEEKVYGGNFELPKEKIAAYFEEGFLDRRGKEVTYSSIVLGLAPGGVIVVWLHGGGKVVEIAHYKAQQIQIAIKDYYPGTATGITTEEFIKEIKGMLIDEHSEVKSNQDSIPYGIWDTYRKKYKWAPSFKFKSPGNTELDQSFVSFFNGELFRTIGTNPKATQMEPRAIPDRLGLYWFDQNNNRYGSNIFLNEKEMFELFDMAYIKDENEQAKLVVEVDKYNSSISIFLKTDKKSYPIQKARIKIYPSPKR